VTGSVYNLLQSYLSGRSQFVRLGEFRSDHLHTDCGVPQGSVLRPLLFAVYVNDIGTNIKSSISLFADDTILLCSSKNPSALHTMLSNDVRQLEMWSDLWSVAFNAAKTEVLTITNNPSLHPPLRFYNQALNETTSHKHPGHIFHQPLTWRLHISALHHRTMSIINALKKIKNFLPRYSLLVLYRAYVLPIVDYGDIIFDRCTTTDSNLLESFKLLQLNYPWLPQDHIPRDYSERLRSYPIIYPSSVSHSGSLPCHPFWTMSIVLIRPCSKVF